MMEDGKFREAWNLGLLDGTEESGNEAAAIRLSVRRPAQSAMDL